jgi:pilus assembly protein CpaB
MGRRTILLVAAVVAAALGTVLVWMYAQRTQQSALAGQEPQQVLVATADIEAGTAASAILPSGLATIAERARADLPADALSSLESVATQVTTTKILAGQVFQPGMFGAQAPAATGRLNPAADQLAVSVSLGDPQRVAGFVVPGSTVAVFVTGAGIDGSAQAQTALLLDQATVLAVGASTGSGTGQTSGDQVSSSLLTLALTQEDAQRLIQAQSMGQLYLGLLGADSGDALDPTAKGTTGGNLLD